jgi:DNA-directed RNA polymerase subunit omega
MNADFVKQALEIVGNPNVLVNLVSRRVRQLNSGGGGISRPLVEPGNLAAADIALVEIIEGKMGWIMPDIIDTPRPTTRTAKNTRHGSKILRAAA